MTSTSQFPFVFDAEKMKDMFKMPEFDKMFDQMQMPQFDMDALIKAQQKNVQALVEANKAAMSGYQEIYRRQVALAEEHMAKAKDQIAELQSQPMSAEASSKQLESVKETLDKLSGELREMADMAQAANTEAFGIVKSRFEEGLEEFKSAAGQMAK
jgi:phasin family protein